MSLIEMTSESLGRQLGREIPDAHVLIAKNSVLGLDDSGIADLLGVTLEEVGSVTTTEEYKEVRLLIAAKYNESQIETEGSWDTLEQKALKNLLSRVDFDKDVDTNLRIAAIANRATRRLSSNLPTNRVLDASATDRRVNLTLSRRIMEKLTATGPERETVESLSITDGRASNISFAEVSQHLGISNRPRIAENVRIRTHEPSLSQDQLLEEMDKSFRK